MCSINVSYYFVKDIVTFFVEECNYHAVMMKLSLEGKIKDFEVRKKLTLAFNHLCFGQVT